MNVKRCEHESEVESVLYEVNMKACYWFTLLNRSNADCVRLLADVRFGFGFFVTRDQRDRRDLCCV